MRHIPVFSLTSLALCSLMLLSVGTLRAADIEESLKETPEQRDARMKWWREARFGMFVHWGPVSLKGTEIGWSRGGERRGNGTGRGSVPAEEYDQLYTHFNPTKFDAREWIRIAQAAGMKYFVFTTKHHDGFCNFDTKLTDYKITSPESPFGRDIVAELARACHEAHMGLGWYYSPPDWHHPDYRTDHHRKYIDYLHGQLRELCTNYGKVDIIWFDGLGGKPEDWGAGHLLDMIRTLQPGVIINNRTGLPADLDTPEQRIGSFQRTRPWETCMTLCNQWAWKPDDTMKSPEQCIQTLVRTAGGDGNLLFNVGPMPDGRIEPRQVERLAEMGRWLARYGESIYATRGGPYRCSAGGNGPCVSTCRGNTVYLHILEYPKDGKSLTLPPLPHKIIRSRLLTGGSATVKQTDEGITIDVPPPHRQTIDTIMVLELDGPAETIEPIAIASDSVAAGRPAKASNVFQNMGAYAASKAFDDDASTRWATDAGTHTAWLEVDLGKPTRISRAIISEACGHRIQAFELQHEVNGQWETFHKGERIGEEAVITFEPLEASKVRLNILKAAEGPTIWEFQLRGPGDGPPP